MTTLLLSLLIVICFFVEKRETPTESENRTKSLLVFRIPAGDSEEELSWWKEDEEHRVVFLPSYADLESVSLLLRDGIHAKIGNIELTDGMSCGQFLLNTDYSFSVQGQAPIKIRFVRSSNLPAMFLHTVSGTEDTIHSQRNVWEYTELRIVDKDGAVDYYGSLDEISGRGSGSWHFDKKSYNLKLSRSESLLGMEAGRRWVLLANVIDESHLRNRMVYQFAREIGSYSGFAPDSAYVDLFLNGSYVGLYLMTEKVEIAENRVEADPNAILFEVDADGRTDRMLLPFVLDWGLAVGIKSPKSCTEEQRDLLMNRVFLFQDTLLSDDGEQDALQYIDLESWTRRYLIDEVFENYDGGCHSQFFFWDPRKGQDNRIFAGPCWDYDNCADGWFMAIQNPRCFLMQREWKNDGEHTPWYRALMQQKAFRERVLELYRTELSPKLHQMLESGVNAEASVIMGAARLNAIRWGLGDPEPAVQHFHDFMKERVAFLDSAWIEGVEYRTITAKSIWDYRYYCTQPGTACEDLPLPEDLGMEKGSVWILEDSGALFDPETPIVEDITVVGVPYTTGFSETES